MRIVPLGAFCNDDHAIKHASKKLLSNSDKKARREAKDRKLAIKPKSKWLAELQALVNKYIRLRDANEGCISCDKAASWQGQFHAGHYYSRGHSSSLRFNLHNIHKQCSVCNNHLSGNIGEYTPALISKIGLDKFEQLTANKSNIAEYDIDWIKRAIKIAKRAIKRADK
jgi:hypothetical protein